MLNSLIAEAVKAHTRAQGITPGEVARRLGTSTAYVSALLNGRKPATPSQWERVAAAVGYDLSVLIAGDEQQELAAIRQRLDVLAGAQAPAGDLDPWVQALMDANDAGALLPRLTEPERAFLSQFRSGAVRSEAQALTILTAARAVHLFAT